MIASAKQGYLIKLRDGNFSRKLLVYWGCYLIFIAILCIVSLSQILLRVVKRKAPKYKAQNQKVLCFVRLLSGGYKRMTEFIRSWRVEER
ncbi:hypothetical protein CV014_13275 [Nostoc sp. CMAA1605]|nr:hypothetical protein [Nostoc sp. CMAA1605]